MNSILWVIPNIVCSQTVRASYLAYGFPNIFKIKVLVNMYMFIAFWVMLSAVSRLVPGVNAPLLDRILSKQLNRNASFVSSL